MVSNKVVSQEEPNLSTQEQIPNSRKKVAILSRANTAENHLHQSGTCDCDEELEDALAVDTAAVSDTVWKIGCYKINPSTPSGI